MASSRRSVSLAGVAFFAGAALVGSARPAVATPVTLETNISINTGCDPFASGSCLSSDDPVDIEIWGPLAGLPGWTPNWTQGWGLVSHAATYGPAGEQLIVSADANADFGVLQVRAAAEYDLTALADPGGYRFVAASAQFGEALTPSSDPSLLGTPGLLEVHVGVDGRLEASGTASAFVLTAVQWETSLSPNGEQFYIFDSGSATDVGETLVVNIPFVWGESVGFSVWMAAAAGTARPCLPEEPCEFGVTFERQNTLGAGSAEFFNTLAITGLVPYDQFGNPVLNATFGSASGARYTIEGVERVPEPGSLLLLGTGLAMGIRRLRRRIA